MLFRQFGSLSFRGKPPGSRWSLDSRPLCAAAEMELGFIFFILCHISGQSSIFSRKAGRVDEGYLSEGGQRATAEHRSAAAALTSCVKGRSESAAAGRLQRARLINSPSLTSLSQFLFGKCVFLNSERFKYGRQACFLPLGSDANWQQLGRQGRKFFLINRAEPVMNEKRASAGLIEVIIAVYKQKRQCGVFIKYRSVHLVRWVEGWDCYKKKCVRRKKITLLKYVISFLKFYSQVLFWGHQKTY